MLDPLLDLLDIPTWRIDRGQDITCIATAYRTAERESRPVAVVFERNMRWSS